MMVVYNLLLIKPISDCSESFVPLTTRGRRIILSDIFPLFCVVSEVASDLDFFKNGCLHQTFVKTSSHHSGCLLSYPLVIQLCSLVLHAMW